MNQQQRKYAKERLQKILSDKKRAIENANTTKATYLTTEQRFKAFKRGKYKVRTDAKQEISSFTNVVDLIIFEGETARRVDKKKMAAQMSKANDDYQRIMDELMLGDCDKALELIVKFEKS